MLTLMSVNLIEKVELPKSVLGVPVSIQKILGKKSKAGERDCALDIKEPIN